MKTIAPQCDAMPMVALYASVGPKETVEGVL